MMKILSRQQDPILQRLTHPLFEEMYLNIWLMRLDIIHNEISGNKWFKLSGNFREMFRKGSSPTVITFGGAYSNHLYSTAAACFHYSLPSVGVIRGELVRPLNPTLAFCESHGMTLLPVSREEYRDKERIAAVLREEYDNVFIVPEGG
ncbi:MAG: 1-aminocyclopropane-1-carboxylate deaminase/D-cysteine desulfhydrase, partial [Cyclobacteriaceae bacterium]